MQENKNEKYFLKSFIFWNIFYVWDDLEATTKNVLIVLCCATFWRELNWVWSRSSPPGPILSGIRELNVGRMWHQNLFKYVHLACSLNGQTWGLRTLWTNLVTQLLPQLLPSLVISPSTRDFRLSSRCWLSTYFGHIWALFWALFGHALNLFWNYLGIPLNLSLIFKCFPCLLVIYLSIKDFHISTNN